MIERVTCIEQMRDCGLIGESFYKEAALPGQFKIDRFLQVWAKLIEHGLGALWVYRDNGQIVGSLGAMATPDINDGELVATEAFWYVLPSHRGQRGGIGLLDTFEAWADEIGAKRKTMVALKSMPDSVKALYLSRGFREIETHYIKEAA